VNGLAIGLLVLWLVLVAVRITALLDAVKRPAAAFAAVGRRKGSWALRLCFFGWIAGIVYLLSVRPQLQEAERRGLPSAPEKERAPLKKKDWGDPFG